MNNTLEDYNFQLMKNTLEKMSKDDIQKMWEGRLEQEKNDKTKNRSQKDIDFHKNVDDLILSFLK